MYVSQYQILEQPLLLYLENQFTTDIGKTSTLNQK